MENIENNGNNENNENNETRHITYTLNESKDNMFVDMEYIMQQFELEGDEEEEKEESEEKEENVYDESDEDEDCCIINQLALFEMSSKQLELICSYYEISTKNIKKKQLMIEQILLFENNLENRTIVKRRNSIWSIMDKLKQDKIIKRYIIWP